MKICIWTNMPNHNQVAFFSSLRQEGIDLVVRYYERVSAARVSMGWPDSFELGVGEQYLVPNEDLVASVPDFAERIHVIPGYHTAVCRKLALYCSHHLIPWVHWSEAATPGWRWLASWPRKRWWANLVNRYALGAFGTGHLAVNDFVGWGIRREKIGLLPYCVTPGNRQIEPDPICRAFTSEDITFIFLGRLSFWKGTDTLLQAFQKVLAGGKRAKLVLVGPDTSRGQYAKLVERYGIADSVLFRGPIRASACETALRCAHVLVLPTRYDGWGMVLSEAASMGLAIISSDAAGGSEHLIESGVNGFIVKAGNVCSLAAAMGAYCNDQSLARVHGVRSLSFFDRYSSRQNAKRLSHGIESWLAMART